MANKGDEVGGDKITVGDISGSKGIAIGRGAKAHLQISVDEQTLVRVFSPVYEKIETRPPDPKVDKDEIVDKVKRIENEVQKGESAEPDKIERWLGYLAEMAPDILDVTTAALTSPIAGVSAVIQKIALKAKQERKEN